MAESLDSNTAIFPSPPQIGPPLFLPALYFHPLYIGASIRSTVVEREFFFSLVHGLTGTSKKLKTTGKAALIDSFNSLLLLSVNTVESFVLKVFTFVFRL